MKKEELRYLQRLAELYPTIAKAVSYTHLDVYKRQDRSSAFDHGDP